MPGRQDVHRRRPGERVGHGVLTRRRDHRVGEAGHDEDRLANSTRHGSGIDVPQRLRDLGVALHVQMDRFRAETRQPQADRVLPEARHLQHAAGARVVVGKREDADSAAETPTDEVEALHGWA